jgi:hypothetical protein
MCIHLMAAQILPVFPFLHLSSHLMPTIFTILDPCVPLSTVPPDVTNVYRTKPAVGNELQTLEPGEGLHFV